MKYLIRTTALCLLASLTLAAANKTFTWEPPTEREPDPDTGISAILLNSEIKEYRIYCDGDTVMPVHIQPNVPLDMDTWIAPHNKFAVGTHTCFATTVDIGGLESVPSNTVNFTVTEEPPRAPVLVVQ